MLENGGAEVGKERDPNADIKGCFALSESSWIENWGIGEEEEEDEGRGKDFRASREF